MSIHAAVAKVHAARAMDAVSRAQDAFNTLDVLTGAAKSLGELQGHIRILVEDIENLTKEKSACPQ